MVWIKMPFIVNQQLHEREEGSFIFTKHHPTGMQILASLPGKKKEHLFFSLISKKYSLSYIHIL